MADTVRTTFTNANTGSNVIQFPSRARTDTAESSLSVADLADPTEFTALVAYLERFVANTYIQNLSVPKAADNPFDAVYISALKPDWVPPEDVRAILNGAAIVDLSSDIDFDDELGD